MVSLVLSTWKTVDSVCHQVGIPPPEQSATHNKRGREGKTEGDVTERGRPSSEAKTSMPSPSTCRQVCKPTVTITTRRVLTILSREIDSPAKMSEEKEVPAGKCGSIENDCSSERTPSSSREFPLEGGHLNGWKIPTADPLPPEIDWVPENL